MAVPLGPPSHLPAHPASRSRPIPAAATVSSSSSSVNNHSRSNGTTSSAAAGATSSTANAATTSDITKYSSKRLAGHASRVRTLAWNIDGRRLASGSGDKILKVWTPEKDLKSSVEYRGHTAEIGCVRWNPTHPERLGTCSSATDKDLHFWDMRQGSRPTGTVETEGSNIHMAWSPDGKTVIVGNRSDVVLWIDVEQQKVLRKIEMRSETNEAVFSHNGSLLITAVDGKASICAFPTGDPVHDVHISPAPTTVLDLDPRGRYLAAGSNDATLTIWETKEWTCAGSMGAHDDPLRNLRFSHDGQYLASTCGDPEIIISEVPTLKQVHSIPTGGGVDSLAWHPSRNILAYGNDEAEGGRVTGAIRIWGM